MTRAGGLATALLLLSAAPARTGEAADFRLSQAVQGERPSSVMAYLDVWDTAQEPVAALAPDAVSATLGDQALAVEQVRPFRETGEGVGYIFCVDVSRSLSPDAFAQIRGALGRWIDGLAPGDRAAVLAFGDESRVLVDFTADAAVLRDAVATLAPTDMQTVLHRGLRDAIELSSRRDPDLPARRVLIVLSDGQDEGSGLVVDDVLSALRERPLPIHAVAFGRPSRREALDLLQRLATHSGGSVVAVRDDSFAAAYTAVHEAIDRVWVVELECPQCAVDGQVRRLQVNLQLADRVLSKGIELRLLPPLEPAVAAAAPAGAAAAAAAVPGVVVPEGDGVDRTRGRDVRGAWIAAGVLAVAIAVVGGALAVRGARGRRGDNQNAPAPARHRPPREKLSRRERKILEVPLDAEPPVPPIALCLTVVRGAAEGSEHRFLLERRGVLGSGAASHFQVVDPALEGEQVELVQERGGVYARNLSRAKPTLLNGAPLGEPKELQNGDLLGSREFIVRVRLG